MNAHPEEHEDVEVILMFKDRDARRMTVLREDRDLVGSSWESIRRVNRLQHVPSMVC